MPAANQVRPVCRQSSTHLEERPILTPVRKVRGLSVNMVNELLPGGKRKTGGTVSLTLPVAEPPVRLFSVLPGMVNKQLLMK
jgi:hypothetical protein